MNNGKPRFSLGQVVATPGAWKHWLRVVRQRDNS